MSVGSAEQALREALDDLALAGDALRRRTPAQLAETLADAWERIADPERALGRAARGRLPQSSGLTLPMVAWALSTTLGGARASLAELARRMEPPPGTIAAPHPLGALILAGNVFTACVQPLSVGLLSRTPLLVKASSADDVLPRLFVDALREVDPELAAAVLVVSFPRDAAPLEATILHHAAVVSVYGSDPTLAAIRACTDANTAFIAHGHGLGLGWVDADADLEEAAGRFALDVAAYDQRGCMSPHAIAIERDGERFASELAHALDRIASELPRGALPTETGASQMQWRGVAAARGVLHEGDGWAVSFEPGAAPRLSPGARNVVVCEMGGLDVFATRAATIGPHLKSLGVAGDVERVARALPAGVSPRVCSAGTMQTPGLLAYADGLPPWEGWQRFVTVG